MQEQFNHLTGLAYQGRNQAELQNAKEINKYKSDEWLTFLQAKEKGLKLVNAKGKGVGIFKGFKQEDKKDKDGHIKTVSYPVGFATVFNLDLTEVNK